MVWYGILILFVSILLGYLFGSIPNGVIISKAIFKYDVRDYGSHNSGGTNAGRVMGKKYGVIVIILDMLKVIVPFLTVFFLITCTNIQNYCLAKMPEISYYSVILAATIGHCWPVYIGFRGGKAAACAAGSILATSYISFATAVLSFFSILKITKHVSASSIITSWVAAALSYLVFIPNFGKYMVYPGMASSFVYPIVMTLVSIILTIRHKSNIKRIINNEESQISWMK